ncbi:MAG TPA: sigma-70 family RNA polymerase sigma factor [Sphingomonas sp.]|jgi:RNA polymerase sigma-70 factor (ECF subfamily)|nr:sigma-70 family RNA polymerase sigma factor [Sphingomonas sp.]
MADHEPAVTPAGGLITVFFTLRPALARFLAARGAQSCEVEDLLQELYLKLGEASTGPVAEPRAYLYRTANNLLIDLRRAMARRVARDEAWVDSASAISRDVDPAPSVEEALLARERLDVVSKAMTALPDRTRDIFRRYRLAGEPQKAIAADMAISVSAVEKHLQRAYRAVIDARAAFDADLPAPHRLRGERGEHGA